MCSHKLSPIGVLSVRGYGGNDPGELVRSAARLGVHDNLKVPAQAGC